MELKLNSLPSSIFEVNAQEFGGSLERADIVAVGRALMADRNGRDLNALRALEKKPEEYTPRMDDATYSLTNENLKRKMVLYAAKLASNFTGEIAPATYEDFLKVQRNYMTNSAFFKVLGGLIRDIVSPVLPTIMSNALSWIAQVESVPFGETLEIDIGSNDVFIFEEDSWGATKSKPANNLYSTTVTLNPVPRSAAVSTKWSQLVGNRADIGRFLNSLVAGMYNKILALAYGQLAAAASNTKLVPTNLTFNSQATANWINARKRVAMLAGTSFMNVVAYGDLAALSQALPDGMVNSSTTSLDAALATMLGVEWARYGYLTDFMGCRLMPWENAVVPGTQNTTITELLDTDKIWFGATVGYKPVHVAVEEGTPMLIEISPRENADQTIDIFITISVAALATMATKMAVMTVV